MPFLNDKSNTLFLVHSEIGNLAKSLLFQGVNYYRPAIGKVQVKKLHFTSIGINLIKSEEHIDQLQISRPILNHFMEAS